MIEACINEKYVKKQIQFPKLMRGIKTGTIYLALSQRNTVYGPQTKAIVIHSNKIDQKVGDTAYYSSDLFEDFNGEILLRNKDD